MLNALRQSDENHPLWPSPSSSIRSCAQRLTAIRGKSLGEVVFARKVSRSVLNALRQSEENHEVIPIKGASPQRAQRLTAIRGKSPCSTVRLFGGEPVCSTPYGNQRKITAHPRILTLQGSDGAFASMYPYSIHQLPARRQVS